MEAVITSSGMYIPVVPTNEAMNEELYIMLRQL